MGSAFRLMGLLSQNGRSPNKNQKQSLTEGSSGCGGITPLKALRGILEEEVLCIPITEEASPLLPAGPRITLDLVPLASERVNDLTPDVGHDLGSHRGGISKDLRTTRGPDVLANDATNNLPGRLPRL